MLADGVFARQFPKKEVTEAVMDTSTRPIHKWQTLWSIAGPELPSAAIWLTKNIHIRPRNAEEAARKSPSTTPIPSLSVPHGLFVVHYPPRDEVQGSHRVQIDVEAESEDAAVKLAEKISERLTVTLSLAVSGAPYFSQLLAFRRADKVEEYSGWSQSARISPLAPPSVLNEEKLKSALKISQLVEEDETANNAFLHLSTAWQLQSTSGSKPLQRSILQHYVLSIEAVVNGAMEKIRVARKDAIKLGEQLFAKEFSEALPKRADKAKAIREASTKLREISLANMIPSIDTVGPIMRLPESVCRDARDLYRFRSRNLSHPGKKENDEMNRWLSSGPKISEHCLADTVSRSFLIAYCEHISV